MACTMAVARQGQRSFARTFQGLQDCDGAFS
jgi:hypothetical protein